MEKDRSLIIKTVIQLLLVLVIVPLLPILITWRWNWWEAWVLALTLFLGFVISRILAGRKHKGLLAERVGSMGREDAKPWDRYLAPAMAFGGILVLILAGLDARFGWTPQPFVLWLKLAAIGVLVLAYAFSAWAMVENAFFSGVVRIQTERGHAVCESGPYRFLRHPGYAGSNWAYLVMPIILDSAWAYIPALLLLVVTVLRTRLEDRTLQDELPGYREYAGRVKWRLFPGLW